MSPTVQRAHEAPLRARGFVQVAETGRLSAWVGRALQMPRSGQQEVILVVEETPDGMVWTRNFDTATFVSYQTFSLNQMHERIGHVILTLDLDVKNGDLHYRTTHCSVFGITVPRKLTPITEATVSLGQLGWSVEVRVTAPFVGVVCHYRGEIIEELS